MTAVNEAWRVLSDPGRRAMYDAGLRGTQRPVPPRPQPMDPDLFLDRPLHDSPQGVAGLVPRFAFGLPWVLVLVVLGVIFVFTAFAVSRHGGGVDGILHPGSCIDVTTGLVAREVSCSGPHDGIVERLVSPTADCPSDLVPLRDAQSAQKVCAQGG
jgi:molecular chaperone DnaJ